VIFSKDSLAVNALVPVGNEKRKMKEIGEV
jgi:hypothetical protein